MDMTQTAFTIGAIVGSLVSGAIIGSVPLVLGNRKNQKGLAIGGFFACLVGSLIAGLILSLPMCVLFGILISVKAKKAEQQQAENQEKSADDTVA
jgi:MFS family permease